MFEQLIYVICFLSHWVFCASLVTDCRNAIKLKLKLKRSVKMELGWNFGHDDLKTQNLPTKRKRHYKSRFSNNDTTSINH